MPSHFTGNDCTGQVRVADICADKGWNVGLIKMEIPGLMHSLSCGQEGTTGLLQMQSML